MRTTHLLLTAATLLAASSLPLHADIIQMRDGTSHSGSIRRDGKSMVITTDDGRTLTVDPDSILRVTLTSTVTPAQAADSDWTRTTALIKKADSLTEIIQLHETFLAKHPDSPTAPSVRTSLEEYKKLQKQDGVRFRGNWVPRAQVEVLLRRAEEQAAPALQAYRAGKMKEAIEAANAALKLDDNNHLALAIAGMAAYRSNQLPLARNFFTKLADSDPGNLIALNNIAVIANQQKRESDSILFYTKALAAAPDNRLLLDNITEALNSYKGDRNAAIYKDLLRQFDQAELRMEAAMAKKGLFRYGSTWVEQDTLDKATTQTKAVKDAMVALDQQYRETLTAAAQITSDIKASNNDFSGALSDINYYNLAILQAQHRGDDTWYLITRRDARLADLEKLRRNIAALNDQLTKIQNRIPLFKAQAEKLKLQLASVQTAQFSGIQRIMDLGDAEKVPPPAILAPAPVTNPADPAPAPQPSITDPTPQPAANTILPGPIDLSVPDPPVSRDTLEIEMFNTYRQLASPIYTPFIFTCNRP